MIQNGSRATIASVENHGLGIEQLQARTAAEKNDVLYVAGLEGIIRHELLPAGHEIDSQPWISKTKEPVN